MKFIDLFAGIGGFRSGLEQSGHQCVGYVEWDKYARTSYQAMVSDIGPDKMTPEVYNSSQD